MCDFYTNRPEPGLRLGDVITGFPVTTPQAHRLTDSDDAPRSLVITVDQPRFLVVMTPCCSIEDGSVVLAPLNMVRSAFFMNPYFDADLTRINRRVTSKDSLPPIAWEQMKPEQRAAKLNEEPGLVFLECFVYAPHPLLPLYTLRKNAWTKETGHYLVDFKTLYRLECSLIKRNAPAPTGCNKLLQLTANARKEMRDKLTYFFSRPAKEDLAEMGMGV
ncbi:MAG: hypothetical protein ACYC0Y_24845 [Pirellulales bacterium]